MINGIAIVPNFGIELGMVEHTYDPSTYCVKMEGFQVRGQPGLHSEACLNLLPLRGVIIKIEL